ncbi:uncharacterized protein YqeY [Nocardioides luteus]|uniref:GatB/YqeY n=1 Tax=Nocardioides luteus TaxID=1844 RepID=A0ABQ5SU77_9ACTN|nr:hypothetical protein [Nocardioides luteus]MDR7309933.1 uncharacterized protein YqeY [Nocardioides luteus]GGR59519.1 hypothetical protein GCM10010197_27920 [Nocardioides luteus]GLJ67158.1 hypothetical protein GCM10017579_11940 [Nocardioides luteus]
MTDLQARLRADLLAARKARDTTATSVLRSTLSAIANAEALPVAEEGLSADGPIAGAASGVGATEAARRDLTDDDVRAVISGEQTERLAAATALDSHGAAEKATQLRAEADLLAAYL